ncbi:hypothetical protein H6F88_24230 [Oculatella sp. FACHB-28]|uniref:hypothetical protein n=1 Tax=Oculatella sp. FACHB-28 TaxID=2692845 RepID=UPI00168910FF|nr:hypothetical protein [Oculatella sp. FACHB-28]MBD2059068.1 hypothetical protein [Oculatella sp. FACHB-28]
MSRVLAVVNSDTHISDMISDITGWTTTNHGFMRSPLLCRYFSTVGCVAIEQTHHQISYPILIQRHLNPEITSI